MGEEKTGGGPCALFVHHSGQTHSEVDHPFLFRSVRIVRTVILHQGARHTSASDSHNLLDRCRDSAAHTSLFPALGRLREDGSGYSWVPVVFTDRWDEKQ